MLKRTELEKLFGVKIGSKLTFGTPIKTACEKASNILRSLTRVTPYITIKRRKKK